MSQPEEQHMAEVNDEQLAVSNVEPCSSTQAAEAADADAVNIDQDLVMLLQSGAVAATPAEPQDLSDVAQAAQNDFERMSYDGDNDIQGQKSQSLTHFREMVAAARASAEASKAKQQNDPDTTSAEVEQEPPRAASSAGEENIGHAIAAAPLSNTFSGDSEAPAANTQDSGDQNDDSDTDAASSSSSNSSSSSSGSDSDSDTETITDERKRAQQNSADARRVETLPAWASADYEDSDDYDEDDEGGKNGNGTSQAGPTTKNEVVLTVEQLKRPTLTVLSSSEPIHYLGKVSSIIGGTVVVVEQDVRNQKNGFNQTQASGKSRRMNGNAPLVAGEEDDKDVLDTGSLLVYSNRKVLGTVFETFGSVLQPMYTVRFASAEDVPSLDLDDSSTQADISDNTIKVEEEDDEGDIDGEPVALTEVQVHEHLKGGSSTKDTAVANVVNKSETTTQGLISESVPSIESTSVSIKKESEMKQPQSSEESQASAATATSTPLTVGTPIYYASNRAAYVFTPSLRRDKGSDASNLHDEEIAEEEMEYSDDEAEAEAKRRNKKGKSKGKKGQQVQDMEGVEMHGTGTSSSRGHGRARGGAAERGPNMRGRGQGTRDRGRGRGSGRFSGGVRPSPIRHRDDMSDPTMTQPGHTAAAFSFSMNGGSGLPASLPARPQFDYDFDNTGATAAHAPGSSGRRSNPAPYDERAGGVQHTLTLPTQPPATTPTTRRRPAQHSSSASQQQSAGLQQQAYAQQQPQLYHQQHYQQQVQQVMHINPLFAQQWSQYPQGQTSPYNYMAAQQGYANGYPYAQPQQQYAQGYQSNPHGGPAANGSAGPGEGSSSNLYYPSQQHPQ